MEICNLPNKILCLASDCWLAKPCVRIKDCMIRVYKETVNEFVCRCGETNYTKPMCVEQVVEQVVGHSVDEAAEDGMMDSMGYIIMSICILIVLVMLYYWRCVYKYCCCCLKGSRINLYDDNDSDEEGENIGENREGGDVIV